MPSTLRARSDAARFADTLPSLARALRAPYGCPVSFPTKRSQQNGRFRLWPAFSEQSPVHSPSDPSQHIRAQSLDSFIVSPYVNQYLISIYLIVFIILSSVSENLAIELLHPPILYINVVMLFTGCIFVRDSWIFVITHLPTVVIFLPNDTYSNSRRMRVDGY